MNINFKQCNTSNFSSGRISSIKWLVMHFTANNGDTAKNNADYFARQPGLQASAHYFVDITQVVQVVEDYNTAWSVGVNYGSNNLFNQCKNNNSINEIKLGRQLIKNLRKK